MILKRHKIRNIQLWQTSIQIRILQIIPQEGQPIMNDQNEMQHQDPNFTLDIKTIKIPHLYRNLFKKTTKK